MPALPKSPNNQGQMLLSILIAIAVFSILAHALFTLISSSFDLATYNKSRITARYLAQQKIETIRNLPYNEVGTIGGIPASTIMPQSESINRNGLNYTIKTDIVYIDDPYDQLAPTDLAPEDYKRVRVEVYWEGLASSRKNPVVMLSDISSLATGGLDGGTLVIQVFDSNGNPVPQAQVNVVATTITPAVDLSQNTDNEGRITLPGAIECIECYQINASKSGMSTDRTYSQSEVANPSKPHASIFLDQVTQLSFTIDLTGTINISSLESRDDNFTPIGNIPFRLRGNKIIGTDAYAQPVYKYDENLITNDSGSISLSSMEWDVYYVFMPETTSRDISGTSPLLPLILSPAGSIDFVFSTTPYSENSFFVTVKDSSQNLVASASARLYDDSDFEESIFTGEKDNPDEGQAFFPNLSVDTYHFQATASGFLDFTSDFNISDYTKTDIILTPQ